MLDLLKELAVTALIIVLLVLVFTCFIDLCERTMHHPQPSVDEVL